MKQRSDPRGPITRSASVVRNRQDLDLPANHAQPVVERKLVVVERDGVRIALCVDEGARSRGTGARTEVTPRERLGGSQHGASGRRCSR